MGICALLVAGFSLLIAAMGYYTGSVPLNSLHTASGILGVCLSLYMAIVFQMIRTGRVRAKGAKHKCRRLFSYLSSQPIHPQK